MRSKLRIVAFIAFALAIDRLAVLAQPTNPDTPVYLFSTFKEGDQDGLRYAFSYDGYHWSNMPGLFLKAHVGEKPIMRDPSMARGPDGAWPSFSFSRR